jgi:hypothetical protein
MKKMKRKKLLFFIIVIILLILTISTLTLVQSEKQVEIKTEFYSAYITPNISEIQQIVSSKTTIDLCNYISSPITYKKDESKRRTFINYTNGNSWQTPSETLTLKTGDCEDYAFLLCSLLRASGYDENSIYAVRGQSKIYGNYHWWVKIKINNIWIHIEPNNKCFLNSQLFNI